MKRDYSFLLREKKQKKDRFEIAAAITESLFLWLPVIGIGLVMLNYAIDQGGFLLCFFLFSVLSAVWAIIINALAPLVALFSIMLAGLLLLGKKLLIFLNRKFI